MADRSPEEIRDIAIRAASGEEIACIDLVDFAVALIMLASCEHVPPRMICEEIFKVLPDDEAYRKSLEPPV